MRKLLVGGLVAAVAAGLSASTALACGSLVAPNGSVRLARATTLVGWHDGVEHYLTSFGYTGDNVTDIGYIVPLPAIPTSIVEGGAWTLQRLEREVAPPVPQGVAFGAAADAKAQVIEQVQVAALDITVLKGSGAAIIDWCRQNRFLLPQDTHDHLIQYAKGSPIFMAAKYNVGRAKLTNQLSGDGTPVLLTMPTAHPWVPLEVLANDDDPVSADLFLLTDKPLHTGQEGVLFGSSTGQQLPGAPGFTLVKDEAVSDVLYRDLSGDRNMSWVWPGSHLTYLTLQANSRTVTYDLGVGSDNTIRLAAFGTNPELAASQPPLAPFSPSPAGAWAQVLLLLLLAGPVLTLLMARRRRHAAAPIQF